MHSVRECIVGAFGLPSGSSRRRRRLATTRKLYDSDLNYGDSQELSVPIFIGNGVFASDCPQCGRVQTTSISGTPSELMNPSIGNKIDLLAMQGDMLNHKDFAKALRSSLFREVFLQIGISFQFAATLTSR